MEFSALVMIPASSLVIIPQITMQALKIRSTGYVCGLSPCSLGFQAVLFMCLSVSWALRLGMPRVPDPEHTQSFEWYSFVGWPIVNYTIQSIGQIVLLIFSWYYDSN